MVVAVANQGMVVRSQNQTRCRLRDDAVSFVGAAQVTCFLAIWNLFLVDIEIWDVLLLCPIVKSSIVTQIQIDKMTDTCHERDVASNIRVVFRPRFPPRTIMLLLCE